MTGQPDPTKAAPGTWEALDERELETLVGEKSARPAGGAPRPAPPKRLPGWPPGWRRRPPAEDLFGLALSGGGIRSATFNLGVLQELAEKGLLECFHYLSTVSGGGYIGGFWSAWRSRVGEPDDRPFPDSEPTRERPEAPEVRHLREFSNFLRPRSSLFEIETARIVSALIGGVVPCVIIAFSTLMIALGAWWFLAWLFTGAGPGALRPSGWWALPWIPGALYAVLTGIILWFGERRLWRRSKPEGVRASEDERGGYRSWAAAAALFAGVGAAGVWFLAPSPALLLLGVPVERVPVALGNAVFPAIPWLIVAFLLLAFRTTCSRAFPDTWAGRMSRAAVDRTMTRLALSAAVWAALAAVWVSGQLVAEAGVGGLIGAFGTGGTAGGLFAWLRRTLLAQSNQPSAGRRLFQLGMFLYRSLAYLALAAIAAGGAALLVVTYTNFGTTGLSTLAIAALLVLVTMLLTDPHEIGLHKFYRARLVRAYLGSSNTEAYPRGTAEAPKDDLDLGELPDRPFHLICCAANDLSGDPLGTLGRGAESAVVCKLGLQVGDRFRPWNRQESRAPWLSDVLTASGAAFNSHMGQVSARLGKAVTFLLTAIGLRLGLWLENPKQTKEEEPEPDAGTTPGTGRESRKRAPGYLFLRELISDSRADASWIHLSDGAHFENLALYELVRRHCRFILLSDCGADPDRAFDDFGNAVRRVREDFGVEIEIDVTPLQPDPETGEARQPMVAGDILYPPAEPGGKGDAGILLYVKPTLTGNEPTDVTQYAGRNERFPHETTIDQFYDEAQWESYRRLGRHALHSALGPVEDWLKGPTARTADAGARPEALFLRARYFWPPLPDEEPKADRFEAAWAKLEKELDRPELAALRRQVTLHQDGSPDRTRSQPAESGGEPDEARDDALAALPAIRDAVRLMEGLYLRSGFGDTPRSPSHERFMGWLNRLGAWASAPLFQAWWPWLAPFRSGKFNSFMDHTFGLGTDPFREGTLSEIDETRAVTGHYAYDRWRAQAKDRPGPPTAGARCLGYFLNLGPDRPSLNAAVVRFCPRRKEGVRVAAWSFDDLYVAPGLWGMGVGEAFVGALVEHLGDQGFARAEVEPRDETDASDDALYAGARFRRSDGLFVRDLGA